MDSIDVYKSDLDKRSYSAFKSPNGLRILLISDRTIEKSAACVGVDVGLLCDPLNYPGLAHFCEHMLFLGTEKYPDEATYMKFISQHGGTTNACTTGRNTFYNFDIDSDHLFQALDIFAQFFIAPLFTDSATGREIDTIDSENQKNFSSDLRRLNRLQHLLSDSNHAFFRCVSGSRSSLLHDNATGNGSLNELRNQLIRFHANWYSANIMSLVILGKEPIEELYSNCIQLFASVPNNNVTPSVFQSPWLQEHLSIITYMEPFADTKQLELEWPIKDYSEEYHIKPVHYIAHLLGHEAKGSLLTLLRQRGWAQDLATSEYQPGKGFAKLSVSISLTKLGQEHVHEIIHLIYQYIAMVRKEKPQQWIFDECKALLDLHFKFKEPGAAFNDVSIMANQLLTYNLPDVLFGPFKMTKFSPALIDEVMDCLTPANSRVFLVGHLYADKCDAVDSWYGTKYHSEPISDDLIELWSSPTDIDSQLHLPKPNELIATKFDIVSPPTSSSNALPTPRLISSTPQSRLWFAPDAFFHLPKASLFIRVICPAMNESPLNRLLSALYRDLLSDVLNEFSYDCALAGLSFTLRPSSHYISLSFHGYSHKLLTLVDRVLADLVEFKTPQLTRFNALLEEMKRNFDNFPRLSSYTQARIYLQDCLSSTSWQRSELAAVFPEITFDRFVKFVPELFSSLFVESSVYGNLSLETAVEFGALVEDVFFKQLNAQPLAEPLECIPKEYIIPQTEKESPYLYEVRSEAKRDVGIKVYLQLPDLSIRTSCLLGLLVQVISEPFFNNLRTQQQLGYVVSAHEGRSLTMQGLALLIQSSKDPEQVVGRVDEFLTEVKTLISDLSPEIYSNHVKSIRTRLLEQPKSMAQARTRLLVPILRYDYNFDFNEQKAELLNSISKSDLMQFYEGKRIDNVIEFRRGMKESDCPQPNRSLVCN